MSLNYKIAEQGVEILVQLTNGIIKAIPQLVAQIPQIITSIVKGFASGMSRIKEIGANILKGIGEGMLNAVSSLWDTVKSIASTITGWFKNIFGIHSPSKVFADVVGKNLALGIGAGFEDTMTEVAGQMTDAVPTDFDISTSMSNRADQATLFSDMVNAFKEALSNVNIVLDDEVAGKFVTDTVERVVYS